jgi:NAD+ diphosphatase
MLGCRARALSRDITMDANELEDCRWFSRAEARAMIEERHAEQFFAPAKVAIARVLLEQWLAEDLVEDLPSIAQARAQKTA